jgi:hypothetical protein
MANTKGKFNLTGNLTTARLTGELTPRAASTAARKSKVLWNGLFRYLKWLLYFRRAILD